MIKTEHILYINSNTRYGRSRGDGVEFEDAITKLNGFGKGPFHSFEESISIKDYIAGMYPEFEKALDFFDKEFYKHSNEMKTDALMHAKAMITIKKFGLNSEYDFDCEPNKEQLRRLNERIKPKQKSDSDKFAQGFIKDIAFSVIDSCDDYRQANQFLKTIKVVEGIVSEKYPEEIVRKYQEKGDGIEVGLELLSLKKQGLIDDNLKITDIDKFCDSKIVKEFPVGNKIYNLSESLKKLYGRPLISGMRNYQQLNYRTTVIGS